VTLKVTIDPQALPGVRELRVLTPAGLSNPMRFVVGSLPEFTKPEPNDESDGSVTSRPIFPWPAGRPEWTNTPGEDRPLHVQRSRRCEARAIRRSSQPDPYLADAVPGWFQPALTIFGPKGNRVAFADHFRFNQIP